MKHQGSKLPYLGFSWVIDYCYPDGNVYLSCHGYTKAEAEAELAKGSSEPGNIVKIYEETYDD